MSIKITTQTPPPVPQPPRTHTISGLTDAQIGFLTALAGRLTRGSSPTFGLGEWAPLRDACDGFGIPYDLDDYREVVPRYYHKALEIAK